VTDLAKKHCIPCEAGTPPLKAEAISKYLADIPGWQVLENKKLTKEFKFKDFREAMEFVNKAAEIAESEGHHPDIYIFYNLVKLTLFTHAIGGLSENDFILAAKINSIPIYTSF